MRKDVVLNPDLLYTMVKGLNWLKIEDRAKFYGLIENIPEIADMDKESKTKLIEGIVKLLLPGYTSTVITVDKNSLLSEDNPDDPDLDYTFSFSVIYEESKGIPTIDKKYIYDLVDDISTFEFANWISSNPLSHGYIWNLTGVAAKFEYSSTVTSRGRTIHSTGKYLVYRNDIDRIMVERYLNNELVEQVFMKNNELHREDGPASTEIELVDGRQDITSHHSFPRRTRVKHEAWYIDGDMKKIVITKLE